MSVADWMKVGLIALVAVAYVAMAVRYGRSVRDIRHRYSIFDWVVLLLFWWFFWLVSAPIHPFHRMLLLWLVIAAALGMLGWAL